MSRAVCRLDLPASCGAMAASRIGSTPSGAIPASCRASRNNRPYGTTSEPAASGRPHVAGARRAGRPPSPIRSGDRTTQEGPTRARPAAVTPGDRRALASRRLGSRQRRDCWRWRLHCSRGATRGRTLTALDEAKACAERMRNDAVLIDVAVLSGHAWIDLARPDDAESVIGTALAVARRIGDGSRRLAASLALGRCLFWKGQYADARSALALPAGTQRRTTSHSAAAWRLPHGPRWGCGTSRARMSLAREAMEEASRHGDPALVARASCAAAFVHLAIGDVDAVAADVRACVTAARAARDPMRAIRARLLRPKAIVDAAAPRRRRRSSDASGGWIRCISRQSSGRGRTCSSVDGGAGVAGRHGRAARQPVRAGGAVALCRRRRTVDRMRAC